MRTSLRACLLAVFAAVALVIAACGGGDEATPTSVAPTATSPATQATPTPGPTQPAATPTPAGPEPKRGGVLKAREIGLSFRSWDTYAAVGGYSTLYNQDMLSNLVVSDRVAKTTVLPDAAQDWQISSDGRTYTFNLRRDVTWHDGRTFSSQDVLYNLNRAWKPTDPAKTFNRGKMRFVENIEAPDANTIRITLKQPSASFLVGLAVPFMLMYPAHVPDLQAWQQSPVGSGPFKFKSFREGNSIELVRNETYYKKDAAGRALPYLDGVTFFVIPDPAQALAAFRTRNLDCGCGFDNDFLTNNKQTLEREIPGLSLVIAGGDSFDMYFNNKAPWTDANIRKAISAAVDRKLLRDLYRSGLGFFPPTLFLPQDLGGKWSLPTSEMLTLPGFRDPKAPDLQLANDLFTRANVRPANLNADVIIANFFADFGEAVQAVLARTGINARLRILDGAGHSTATSTGNFDIAFKNGGHSWDDAADLYLDNITSTGATNYAKWSDPDIDRLADEQERQLDVVQRQRLLQELARLMLDRAYYVPVAQSPNAAGTQPTVSGYLVGPYTVGSHLRHELLWFNNL